VTMVLPSATAFLISSSRPAMTGSQFFAGRLDQTTGNCLVQAFDVGGGAASHAHPFSRQILEFLNLAVLGNQQLGSGQEIRQAEIDHFLTFQGDGGGTNADIHRAIHHQRNACFGVDRNFFQLDRFELSDDRAFPTVRQSSPQVFGKSFHALFIAEGSGTIAWGGGEEKLSPGQSWLVPAVLSEYSIQPAGKMTVLCVTVP